MLFLFLRGYNLCTGSTGRNNLLNYKTIKKYHHEQI